MDTNELIRRAESCYLGPTRERIYQKSCEKIDKLDKESAISLAKETLRVLLYEMNLIEGELEPRLAAMQKILFTNHDE